MRKNMYTKTTKWAITNALLLISKSVSSLHIKNSSYSLHTSPTKEGTQDWMRQLNVKLTYIFSFKSHRAY